MPRRIQQCPFCARRFVTTKTLSQEASESIFCPSCAAQRHLLLTGNVQSQNNEKPTVKTDFGAREVAGTLSLSGNPISWNKDDEKDVEGPAPGSRLALFQMLARYEKLDVDLAAMGNDKPTEEDDTIAEQEALLKSLSNK